MRGATVLLAEEKTGPKHQVNPKNDRKKPPFKAETVVSIRRKRISNLFLIYLSCSTVLEAIKKIKLAVLMTP